MANEVIVSSDQTMDADQTIEQTYAHGEVQSSSPHPRIQILDETTANQIAAGEVVERPAAAVKELVENSLDAGATRVLVELEEGGKYLIRITDDGCGMGQEDAILSLQRHATSKIRTADDLNRIMTMGFRGEALPSIASVSELTIVTRSALAADAVGVSLRCRGGSLDEVEEIGARVGTSITVENLFYNVPARLKFLKTSSTELGHIVDTLQRFALAYPEVAFRVMNGGQEAFSSPGSGTAMDAAVAVFGRDTARHLATMDHTGGGGIRVHGYIGTPAALKNSRSWQHTFVNRRFVRNKAITRAIDEGFKSVQTLHAIKYPPAVLMLEIDPAQVDVNVSPTKTEVRFTHEGEVFSAVYHAVREALLSGGLVITNARDAASARAGQDVGTGSLLDVPSVPAANTRGNGSTGYGGVTGRGAYTPSAPAEPFAPYSRHDVGNFDNAVRERAGLVFPSRPAGPFSYPGDSRTLDEAAENDSRIVAGDASAAEARPIFDDPFGESGIGDSTVLTEDEAFLASLDLAAETTPAASPVTGAAIGTDYRHASKIRVLAQTRNMYIIAQTDRAVLIIDQHIAHERVLYEMLINRASEGATVGIATQHLIIPLTIEVSRREAMVVEKRLEELRRAGFDLEPFGGDSFLVRAVPASIAGKTIKAQGGPEAVLREIIEEMVEKSASRRLLLPAEEVLITASCKMAVKAGDPLSFEEMQVLVEDLMRCENPYTCPHGRPILIELANGEVDRKFGR